MENAARRHCLRRVGARRDDESEVADLALDPNDGGGGSVREPDLLGKGRRARAAHLPHGPRGVEETPGLRGIRLEGLEARARIREAPAEGREVVELAGGEEEAREVRRRAFEPARDSFSDAWRLHALGEREPGHGLLPLPDERLARQREASPQRARERSLAQFEERPRRVGGQVAEGAAESLTVVDAHLPPELRVEWLRERDALGGRAGARCEALGRLSEEDLGPRIGRIFGPEASGAPREERRRERETRVVGREIPAHDHEVPAALRAFREEGIGRESRDEQRGDQRDVPLAMRLPISGARTSAVRFGITMTCTLSPSFSARVLFTHVGFLSISSTSRLRFSNCAREVWRMA